MLLDFVRFQVDIRFKYDKLAVQTLSINAEVVIVLEMLFKAVVIGVILVSNTVAHTDMALLMLIATMFIQFICAVEADVAKMALWMSLETGFIAQSLISRFVMLMQLVPGIQRMLVRKDLLVLSAQVTGKVFLNFNIQHDNTQSFTRGICRAPF